MDADTGRVDAARAALPGRYLVVLDAMERGLGNGAIAELVGVDVSAVPLLLVVARAKLAEALMSMDGDAGP